MRLQILRSAEAGSALASNVTNAGNDADKMSRTILMPSCSGLSRLWRRSPFGAAEARAATSSFRACRQKDVDGPDGPGDDGGCGEVITCGSAFPFPGW